MMLYYRRTTKLRFSIVHLSFLGIKNKMGCSIVAYIPSTKRCLFCFTQQVRILYQTTRQGRFPPLAQFLV